MNRNNIITPFTIYNNFIRGRIVKLDIELDHILSQHHYPEAIKRILAELAVVSSLIGSQFKEEIIISAQLHSNDYFKYVIVDYESPGFIRGYAELNEGFNSEETINYEKLIACTNLSVTIDRKKDKKQRYQGIIKIEELSLSKAIEKYFFQSEQIKTSVKIAYGNLLIPGDKKSHCSGGIIIQQMPNDADNEYWEEANIFFNTIRDDELIDPQISNKNLIYSVFNEGKILVFEESKIIYKCRCSKEKAENVIFSLGEEEVNSLLIDNKIEISCHFCNQTQIFNDTDIARIFKI